MSPARKPVRKAAKVAKNAVQKVGGAVKKAGPSTALRASGIARAVKKKAGPSTALKASGAPPVVKPLRLPHAHESVTSSGLRVLVAPRGPIPLAAIRLVIPGGASVDPAGKFGLADFTARLMRRGAGGLDADALNEAVEFVGGSMGVGASEDQVEIAFNAPAEHVPAMLEVMGKMLSAPTFAEAEVTSARERTLARIANDLDDPGSLAERAFSEALWGQHPYGHEVGGWPSTVRTFTREDVVAFQRQHFGPRISLLVVVGDVDPDRVHKAAEQALGKWTGGPDSVTPPEARQQASRAGQIILVDKPEQTQSQVRIGTMTLGKTHPDYHAVLIANCILGSGFTSRLVDEIRVNRGLSYGVSSYVAALRGGSTFGIDTFTKTSTTREIIDVALAETRAIREKGITAKELEKAKTYLCGLYPLRLETNESLAGGIADVRLSNLGDDWVEKYRGRLQAVTRAEAGRAAKEHLLRDTPAIVVVGRAEEVAPQLEGLGPITVRKVSELE